MCNLCGHFSYVTTLKTAFNVTHYLELHNAISIMYTSYFTSKCQLGCVDIVEHYQLYMVKKQCINNRKDIAPCKSK